MFENEIVGPVLVRKLKRGGYGPPAHPPPPLPRQWLRPWYSGHIEIFQSHVVEKIFQNLRVRLKFNIR